MTDQELLDQEPPSDRKGNQKWQDVWEKAFEEEKLKVDLLPWMHLSAEDLHRELCEFFDKCKWSLLKNGRVSPQGTAYHDALIQLRDEKREYEQICEFMVRAGLKDEVNHIENIDRSPITWAECGCCKEDGGDYTVFLSTNKTIEFDSYGSLIKKEPTSQRFLWLRKKT